jgi:hypothetical protein
MPWLLFFACLLLAACSPIVVTVPAAGGELLPEQIQRAADAYTATARVVATSAALATAGEKSARATSTTAALTTRDALVMQQTQAALQLTQAAGQALATDAAAVRTQAAAATAAWASPTAAAVRTQAALDEIEQRRRLANAESTAEFWRTLRTTLIALLRSLAIVACVWLLARAVVAVWDRITQVRTARIREKAAIAREAFRLLGPGHWAEWQPADGYQVYSLPERLDTPPVLLENPEYRADRLQAWRHAVRLFAWWGDRFGFGIRDLGPAGAGVVSDPAWRKLSKLLKDAGVLAEVVVPDQKGKVTTWAPDWSYPRFSDELGSLTPPLTLPVADDPPDVRFAVPTTTPQLTQHT